MIMSIGVCIAATIIYFKPEWKIADPICTVVFSIIVCVTVTPIVKNCINVLMEGAPPAVDIEKLISDIKSCKSDEDTELTIRDFHLWSISVGKHALSAHIGTVNPNEVLRKVTTLIKNDYKIENITLQMEDLSKDNEHQFESDTTTHKKFDV